MKEVYNNRPFIEVNNVTFAYKKSDIILKDISTSFKKGEFTAIIGPNGSGKTTFGKLITGILTSNKGNIFVEGKNIEKISLGTIGKKIGYLFQQPSRQLFNPTVREEIGFAHSFMGENEKVVEEKVDKIIKEFSLKGLEDSSPYKISRGERQRVALASIFINEPSFLILDEPTTGLDMVRKEKLSQLLQDLQDKGIGIIVISHDDKFIDKNAERVIEICGGGFCET